jgi:hypothetical protein
VRRRTPIALLASCLALLAARDARAFDIPKVEIGKAPIRVDVTEVSTMGWRFKPRTAEGQAPADGGWGFWINRLNVACASTRRSTGTAPTTRATILRGPPSVA